MDLTAKAREINKINKEKGFWDRERTGEEVRVLIVSELIEAMEEVRKQTPASYFVDSDGAIIQTPDLSIGSFEKEIGLHKPEGEIVEIADAVIRILDVIGNMIEKEVYEIKIMDNLQIKFNENEMINYYYMIESIYKNEPEDVLSILFCYAKHRGFDLEAAIYLKVEFNKTRPHKHGKKY